MVLCFHPDGFVAHLAEFVRALGPEMFLPDLLEASRGDPLRETRRRVSPAKSILPRAMGIPLGGQITVSASETCHRSLPFGG